MPRYMLDADTVSYALRGHGRVGTRLLEHQPSEVCISAITLAELNFGAEAKQSQKIRRAIRRFTNDIVVVPFDEASAERFGVVAAALATRGQPIGLYDTLVATGRRTTRAAGPLARLRSPRPVNVRVGRHHLCEAAPGSPPGRRSGRAAPADEHEARLR